MGSRSGRDCGFMRRQGAPILRRRCFSNPRRIGPSRARAGSTKRYSASLASAHLVRAGLGGRHTEHAVVPWNATALGVFRVRLRLSHWCGAVPCPQCSRASVGRRAVSPCVGHPGCVWGRPHGWRDSGCRAQRKCRTGRGGELKRRVSVGNRCAHCGGRFTDTPIAEPSGVDKVTSAFGIAPSLSCPWCYYDPQGGHCGQRLRSRRPCGKLGRRLGTCCRRS